MEPEEFEDQIAHLRDELLHREGRIADLEELLEEALDDIASNNTEIDRLKEDEEVYVERIGILETQVEEYADALDDIQRRVKNVL